MNTAIIKYIHISSVLLSFSLFFMRGVWMLRSSAIMQQRWVRVVPHIVDTILLLSALALAYQLSISPLSSHWLMAKIVALLLYVLLGTIAIKRGKTKSIRFSAWIAAQIVFLYIVTTALTHNPLPWQTLLK